MDPTLNITSVRQLAATTTAFARLAASGGKLHALRHNNLLRKDEWKEIDDALIQVASEPLVGIDDLLARNLVQPLGSIGTLTSEYERLKGMKGASVSMDADTPPQEDTAAFDLVGVPVPFISKAFRISARRLLASRMRGDSIDTTNVQEATRVVRETSEDILFNGLSFTLDGNKVYGYRTHPDRKSFAAGSVPGVTNDGKWETIGNIYLVVNHAVGVAEDHFHFGPYGLYIASSNYKQMRAIYDDGSGQSALERCLDKIPNLEFIKPSYRIPAGECVLVDLNKRTVDMAIAEEPMVIPWDSMGGLVDHYLVAAVWIPRVKSEATGKSGLVHATGLS